MARVAITGATGFIGRRLCTRLAAEGHAVRALVRGAAKAPADAEIVIGTLEDAAALGELATGVDVVVHLAGSVRGVDRPAFDRVNVDGSDRLARAVRDRAPDAHFVHVSTLAAREPTLSDYAGSKRTGEDVVRNHLTRVTILRPTAVYGPGDVELAPLLETMAGGFATAPGSAENRLSFVHVDDLVSAIALVVDAGPQGETPWEIASSPPEGIDWHGFAAAVASVTGRGVRVLRVPRALLSLVAGINRSAARLTGRAPMLTPGKVRELTHPDWASDASPFQRAYGWSPRVELAEGIAGVLAGTGE